MHIIKNRQSSLKPISNIMDDAIKDIIRIIGYEKTMLLKDWKKAFPEQYRGMLSFEKMQHKKDKSVILYIKCDNSAISIMLHYDKIMIIEKLARIFGSKVITDFKMAK